MANLLADHPTGMPINKIVPAYKEKFGRDLVVSRYGFSKLIRALEAIQDTVEVRVLVSVVLKSKYCWSGAHEEKEHPTGSELIVPVCM